MNAPVPKVSFDPFLTPQAGQSLPVNDLPLQTFLQETIAGVTALPGAMVRPDWQLVPANAPAVNVNWCSFGILSREADPFSSQIHRADKTVTVFRTEELEVGMTFYGDANEKFAELFREGIELEPNRARLTFNGYDTIEITNIQTSSEKVGERWYRSTDQVWRVRRALTVIYTQEEYERAYLALYPEAGSLQFYVPKRPNDTNAVYLRYQQKGYTCLAEIATANFVQVNYASNVQTRFLATTVFIPRYANNGVSSFTIKATISLKTDPLNYNSYVATSQRIAVNLAKRSRPFYDFNDQSSLIISAQKNNRLLGRFRVNLATPYTAGITTFTQRSQVQYARLSSASYVLSAAQRLRLVARLSSYLNTPFAVTTTRSNRSLLSYNAFVLRSMAITSSKTERLLNVYSNLAQYPFTTQSNKIAAGAVIYQAMEQLRYQQTKGFITLTVGTAMYPSSINAKYSLTAVKQVKTQTNYVPLSQTPYRNTLIKANQSYSVYRSNAQTSYRPYAYINPGVLMRYGAQTQTPFTGVNNARSLRSFISYANNAQTSYAIQTQRLKWNNANNYWNQGIWSSSSVSATFQILTLDKYARKARATSSSQP